MWGYNHQCANTQCQVNKNGVSVARTYKSFLDKFQALCEQTNPKVNSIILESLSTIFNNQITAQTTATPGPSKPYVKYWTDETNIHLDTFCSATCLLAGANEQGGEREPRGTYASLQSVESSIKILEKAILFANEMQLKFESNSEEASLLGSIPTAVSTHNHANAAKKFESPTVHTDSCLAIFKRTHSVPNYTIIFVVLAILGLIILLILQRYMEIFGSSARGCPTEGTCPTLPPPPAAFNTTLPSGFALALPGTDCQATAALADNLTQYLTAWQFPTMSVANMITAVAYNFPANISNFMLDWAELAKCRWNAELSHLMNLPTPSTVTLERIIRLLRETRR